jgi:hypothetical protein
MVDPKLIEERREITKLRAERDRLRSQAAVIRRDYDAACSKALALYQPHTKPHAWRTACNHATALWNQHKACLDEARLHHEAAERRANKLASAPHLPCRKTPHA